MKNQCLFLALVSAFIIPAAHADQWSLTDYIGVNYGTSTTVTAGNVKSTTSDSPSFTDGFEVFYQTDTVFGIGFVFDYNKYSYSKGDPSDSLIGLMLAPRAQFTNDNFKVWASLPFGLELTTLGTSSASAGGLTATTPSTMTNFIVSPRVGFDYQVSEKVFVGLQESYTTGSGGLDVSISNGTNVHEDFSRHFFATTFRVGFNFGSPSTVKAE